MAAYMTMMVVLGGFVLLAPTWSVAGWAMIGLVSVGAMIVGAVRHAPRRRVLWLLAAGSLLLSTIGDAAYGLSALNNSGLPLISEICYFSILPLSIISLTGLTRASVVLNDRSQLLDLLTLTCAIVLVAWLFLIGPALTAVNLSSADRATIALCVVGDLLSFIVTVRLLLAARVTWAVTLLALGSLGSLCGDVLYVVLQLYGGWGPGDISEFGYFILYVCWGAAALHPSMVELTSPVDTRSEDQKSVSTRLMRLSLVIPAGALLAEVALGHVRDVATIGITSIIIGELVLTRLSDIVEKHRRSVTRERVLRQACGSLVGAVDAAEISSCLRETVVKLMPEGTEFGIVVSISDEFSSDAVDCFGEPMVPGLEALPVPGEGRSTEIVRVETLQPALRGELAGFESAILCPLIPRERALGEAGTGALFIAARQRVLEPMRDAAEVVTAQATLAMERIALTDVINRRDGDVYLRTVVRNTADIVLVVDPDDRIRYASPSLTTVLGVEPSAYATLRDIVHPADHELVSRTRECAQESTEASGVRDVWNLLRPDGSSVLVEIGFRDLRKDRMVRGFVITMRDMADQKAREQEIIRRTLESTRGWQNRKSSMKRFG